MNLDDPRIDKYIDHELSDSERRAFLKEIEAFPEIKKYIAFKEYIVQGIQSEGANDLKEYIKTRVADESTESQTTYWLYAVASVAFLLVGYFFITQYIRSGSLETAKNVITLQENYIPPKVYSPRYKAPTISPLDTNSAFAEQFSDSTAIALRTEDSPLDEMGSKAMDEDAVAIPQSATDPQLVESDIHSNRNSEKSAAIDDEVEKNRKEGKPVLTMRKDMAIPTNDKVIGGENHVLKSVNLVAINLNPENTAKENAPMAVAKAKSKPMADTVVDVKTSDKMVKTTAKQKFRLVFIESPNKLQKIDSKMAGATVEISFLNISGENPVLYSIQNKLFVDLAPGSGFIYEIPATAGITFENPKPITDKKILKIINN